MAFGSPGDCVPQWLCRFSDWETETHHNPGALRSSCVPLFVHSNALLPPVLCIAPYKLGDCCPLSCKENNFHICSCILTVLLYSCRNKGVKCPFSSLKKFQKSVAVVWTEYRNHIRACYDPVGPNRCVFFYKLWRKSSFIFLHSKLLRYSGELLGNSFSKSWYVVQWEFVWVLWNVSNIFRAFVRKFVHLLVESFLSILTPVRFSLKIIVASPYPLKHAVSFAYVNHLILTNSLMRYVLLLSLFKMRKLRHSVNCFVQAFTASAELRSGCTFPVSDPHKKEMWFHDTNEQIRSCKSVQLYSGKKWMWAFLTKSKRNRENWKCAVKNDFL